MSEYISDGGFFSYIVLLFGMAAIGVSLCQLARPEKNLVGLAIGLMVTALLFGVVGTGIGMYVAGRAIEARVSTKEESMVMFAASLGIALVPTTLAALLGGTSSLLCGIAHVRAGRVRVSG